MSDEPELSGVDLARVALRAAKEQARQRGEQVREKREASGTGCAAGPGRTAATPCRWGPRSIV